jgi:hypothetical protein
MTIDLTEKMRREEQANGYTLLTFGSRPWLNAQDWMDNAIVSLDGRSVRIVLIAARQPAKGTFSRMITAIIKDRLKPVVINPSVEMEDILVGWNWRKTVTRGGSFERLECWFPPQKFIEKRLGT